MAVEIVVFKKITCPLHLQAGTVQHVPSTHRVPGSKAAPKHKQKATISSHSSLSYFRRGRACPSRSSAGVVTGLLLSPAAILPPVCVASTDFHNPPPNGGGWPVSPDPGSCQAQTQKLSLRRSEDPSSRDGEPGPRAQGHGGCRETETIPPSCA